MRQDADQDSSGHTTRSHLAAQQEVEVNGELNQAIERAEFTVHYQPKVLLATGEVVGVEALIRWEHPDRGLVLPSRFIPFAEETGLIVPLGRWVLKEACRQAKEWQHRYPADLHLTMCVNLSARQFRDPDLVGQVADALEGTGLHPSNLILEITESSLMEDTPSTLTALRELKALGVRLAIDDFGTGYSSLSYLKRFPVDLLKVDRTLIAGLEWDRRSCAIVLAAIVLAHCLGLEVVAEGVETSGECAMLRVLGCDFGQGYYFSKPRPPEKVRALLT
jgi:EAL domain-containing protein (putative c-di-GMP-specific phosphodiesterase class I)